MFHKSRPFYTIIMATYNSAATIERCLTSIVAQQWSNWEVVIQDGCSTDNTLALAQQFADDRINMLSEPDRGIYDAMNKALQRHKGEWILFLGSDDALHGDDVLANIAAVIGAHAGTRFVYGDVLTSANYTQRYNHYNYRRLLEMNICHQAIFYHHTLFTTARYNPKYPLCADWDFNLTVFRKHNHPVYTDIIIANFNLAGKSTHWYNTPEYLQHFSNKKALMLRYRGWWYVGCYYAVKMAGKIKTKLSSSEK